ncbi:hypothetical protein, partial [Escherichia coli]|uniref:hypothetical protein n=1 Tax=Escherichia coli TaxID=562 RepID=UPI001BDB8149
SLTALTAPLDPRQSRVLVLNYLVPLEDGETLSFGAVNSNSDVDSLGGTRVLGKGTTLTWRYGFNRASGNAVHGLSLGFDLKNLKEDVQTRT